MKSHLPPLRERERARKHPAEGVVAMPLPSEPHPQMGRERLRIKWLKASSSLVFFSVLSYTGRESQVLEYAQDSHMLANGAVQIMTTTTQPTMKTRRRRQEETTSQRNPRTVATPWASEPYCIGGTEGR